MASYPSFPLERRQEIALHPEHYALLEEIPLCRAHALETLPYCLHEREAGDTVASIVFLDFETTGLDVEHDDIIELALVRCSYAVERQCLLSVDAIYTGKEQPKEALSDIIVQITGLSTEELLGQRLDDAQVAELVAHDPLMVSHNASFDRPFFDRRFPAFANLRWRCSIQDIPWRRWGSNSVKLEYLLMARGYFYSSHRALADALAVCYLCYLEPEAFQSLLQDNTRSFLWVDGAVMERPERDHHADLSFLSQYFTYSVADDCWKTEVKSPARGAALEKELQQRGLSFHKGNESDRQLYQQWHQRHA